MSLLNAPSVQNPMETTKSLNSMVCKLAKALTNIRTIEINLFISF